MTSDKLSLVAGWLIRAQLKHCSAAVRLVAMAHQSGGAMVPLEMGRRFGSEGWRPMVASAAQSGSLF